jgi:hypothetical protein
MRKFPTRLSAAAPAKSAPSHPLSMKSKTTFLLFSAIALFLT